MDINNIGLKAKIKDIRTIKVKILLIERFDGIRNKLKGFLTQIRMKVLYKGAKLPILLDQVAYTGLFLTGRVLEWFKPYFIEIQENGLLTTNLEVRYIFLSQEGFINRLIQIYGDLVLVAIVERKLDRLVQYTSAIDCTTQF